MECPRWLTAGLTDWPVRGRHQSKLQGDWALAPLWLGSDPDPDPGEICYLVIHKPLLSWPILKSYNPFSIPQVYWSIELKKKKPYKINIKKINLSEVWNTEEQAYG